MPIVIFGPYMSINLPITYQQTEKGNPKICIWTARPVPRKLLFVFDGRGLLHVCQSCQSQQSQTDKFWDYHSTACIAIHMGHDDTPMGPPSQGDHAWHQACRFRGLYGRDTSNLEHVGGLSLHCPDHRATLRSVVPGHCLDPVGACSRERAVQAEGVGVSLHCSVALPI